MSRSRMSIRPIREILRYSYELGLSNEKIRLSLGISKGSVHNTLSRFKSSGLSWPLPDSYSDIELEEKLYGAPEVALIPMGLPSVKYVEQELNRPHVTLQLIYEEYHEEHPNGISRTGFYRYYSKNFKKPVSMKMYHKGGDKLFIDYSGDSLTYIVPDRKVDILQNLLTYVLENSRYIQKLPGIYLRFYVFDLIKKVKPVFA